MNSWYEFINEFIVMKNIVKPYVTPIRSVFVFMNSSMNSCYWIHDDEIIYEIRLWIHVWIQCYHHCYEEYCEIMAEILQMNSHMQSWLNSLILNWSRFSFEFLAARENVLLIQSNHNPFFAVGPLPALRLLRWCSWVATGRRCDGRLRMLHTAEQGGRGVPFKHMMDVTGIEICCAWLSAIKETLETFKLRDYQRDQPQGQHPNWAIRSIEGFPAREGRW